MPLGHLLEKRWPFGIWNMKDAPMADCLETGPRWSFCGWHFPQDTHWPCLGISSWDWQATPMAGSLWPALQSPQWKAVWEPPARRYPAITASHTRGLCRYLERELDLKNICLIKLNVDGFSTSLGRTTGEQSLGFTHSRWSVFIVVWKTPDSVSSTRRPYYLTAMQVI